MSIAITTQSMFSQFQQDLKAATLAVPGMASENVMIGSSEFTANGTFWKHVADTGFCVFIGNPSGNFSLFDFNSMFECTVEAIYPVPADVAYDWVAPNDMLAAIISGWAHWTSNSEWSLGQNRSPLTGEWTKPEIRTYEKPVSAYLNGVEAFIVTTKIVLKYPFISDQCYRGYVKP